MGVQYLGEGVTYVVGVKVLVSTMLVSRGCAMRRSLLQGVGLRDGLVVPVAGVVVVAFNGGVAYKACHRRTMSPCPVVGEIPVCPGCISSGSSRLKRPSVCSPVLPVSGLLEQDQSPCGRGSIVVLIKGL